MPYYYELKIKGHLDPRWTQWFTGLKLTHLDGNQTLLSGQLRDQAMLHGLLETIWDFDLPLISVIKGNPLDSFPMRNNGYNR